MTLKRQLQCESQFYLNLRFGSLEWFQLSLASHMENQNWLKGPQKQLCGDSCDHGSLKVLLHLSKSLLAAFMYHSIHLHFFKIAEMLAKWRTRYVRTILVRRTSSSIQLKNIQECKKPGSNNNESQILSVNYISKSQLHDGELYAFTKNTFLPAYLSSPLLFVRPRLQFLCPISKLIKYVTFPL